LQRAKVRRAVRPRRDHGSAEQVDCCRQQGEHTPEHEYMHQGIAARPFERQFNLEDHVEVEGAAFENGLLQIELARKIPEAMKPRKIEIGAGASTRKTEMKTVDQGQAA